MKIIKKNQLAILVISLMLITAGYLNYDTNYGRNETLDTGSKLEETISIAELGDAELVSADVIKENELENEQNNETNNENKEDNTKETVSQAVNSNDSNYFVQSKLERNVMYSQMIERYQEIINSSSQASDQKAIAQEEINKINNIQNAIMISENLLSSKGFNENVIFINGNSISVIIGKNELTLDEVAQIQNIISRELNATVDNIHISNK